ncbi:MAG: chorismate-binding protein [Ilumatobacteraceae bacterium]
MRSTCDLNDVARSDGMLFVRNGVGLAARGVAMRVPAAEVPDALRALPCTDEVGQPGCGPIALGVLPFRPGAEATFVVPAVIVGKGPDGHQWVTTILDDADDHDAAIDEALAPQPPVTVSVADFSVRPAEPAQVFLDAVDRGRNAVAAGELTKVVLAREIVVETDRPIDVRAVLARLRASFGSSYRYSIDGFIGASPELLVSRHGDICRSHPLAGTAPRTGDPTTDARLAAELIASVKNQVEHRVVIDVVHDALLPYAAISIGNPSRRSWRWPTCSTSPP